MTDLLMTFVLLSYLLIPAGIVWGWVRYFAKPTKLTMAFAFSLIGFGLTTASAMLVAGAAVYSGMVGGFQFYDPRLIKVFRVGALLTGLSVLTSLVGIWKKNPLRWFASICSTGMGIAWFYLMLAE